MPTRLRDRDGILSVRGEEGAGDVALRMESLADVLAGSVRADVLRRISVPGLSGGGGS